MSKEVDKSREDTHTHTSNQRKLQEIREKKNLGLWPGLFEGQTSRTSRRTCDDFGALEVVSNNSLEGQHHLKALELVVEQKRRSKKKMPHMFYWVGGVSFLGCTDLVRFVEDVAGCSLSNIDLS